MAAPDEGYSDSYRWLAERSSVNRLTSLTPYEEHAMRHEETGEVTGTRDKDYDLIWFVETCLKNALRLQTYIRDAEHASDPELAELFRKAQKESGKGAEQGKALQAARLGRSA